MRMIVRIAAPVFLVAFAALAGCSPSRDPESVVAKAMEYRAKADYKTAIIELKNVLQQNPDHAEARYLLGMSYTDIGDLRSGEIELKRALEKGYDERKVMNALGRTFLASGQYEAVLARVKAEGDMPTETRAEVLTLRGMALLGLKRVDEANAAFKDALAERPGYADALLGQARIAAVQGKTEDAVQLIDKAVESNPKSTEAWLMKGHVARLKGDSAGALAAYQKAVDADASNVHARLSMASVNIANAKTEDARKQLAEVRKIMPGNVMAVYMQALVELRDKNYAAARDTILHVLRVAPDHVPSLVLAGAAESALGSHEQAQVHLRRVVENAPDNVYARRLFASSLAKSGQFGRAIEILQAALKQAPNDVGLLMFAGELHMQSGEFDAAEQYFERAAKHAPKSATVLTKLGAARLGSGETENAIADLESAIQLDPDRYQADLLLITSHLRSRSYDEALKAVSRLEEKQPKNPLTHNLKATAYLGKGDHDNARKALEYALQLQPTYVPAAMNLARLDVRDKKPQAGRRRLEAILEKEKDNVAALVGLASLGRGIGASSKEQIAWLERAIKINPRLVQPHLMLTGIHGREGDRKRALESAQRAQAINPNNPQVLHVLGTAQMSAGQKEQGLQTFRKLVALVPNSHVALHELARAEAANGNQAAAAGALRKALEVKPDYGNAQVALFEIELKAKRYPEAMKIAKQVQQQAPKSPIGFVMEGDTLLAEKKLPLAIKAYERGYEARRSGVLAIKLHNAYTQAGKPKEADARLAQWLKESPTDVAGRVYAADVNLKRRNYAEAIKHYEQLPEKNRENVVVLNNLAWSYHQVKDPRALETAERAHKLKPDNPAAADTLGTILVDQGNTKRGIELLQKATSAAPNVPEIRYHLAQGLAKAGDKARARQELERLLAPDTKFPQREEAAKLLKQLSN